MLVLKLSEQAEVESREVGVILERNQCLGQDGGSEGGWKGIGLGYVSEGTADRSEAGKETMKTTA